MWLTVRAFISIVFVGIASAAAQERLGDDRHFYQPTVVESCQDDLGLLGVVVSDDVCFLASGEARFAVGYDSAAGLLTWHSQLLSARAVIGTDFGTAYGVVTVRNEGSWSEDEFPFEVGGLSLYEAYLGIGDQLRVTLGRAPTIIETRDERALDWLGRHHGQSDVFPIKNDGIFPLTANAMQVEVRLSDATHLAVALEDGVTFSNFWGPDPSGARAVGVLAYKDGTTTARATVVGFSDGAGTPSRWAARTSLGSLVSDTFRVLAIASFADDQHPEVLLSASAKLGLVEIAGTVHKLGGQTPYGGHVASSASATMQVSPELALRVGGMAVSHRDDGYLHTALGAIVSLWENAAFTLEGGTFDDEYMSLLYGRAALDWHFSNGDKAKLAFTANSEGAYKLESEFVAAF